MSWPMTEREKRRLEGIRRNEPVHVPLAQPKPKRSEPEPDDALAVPVDAETRNWVREHILGKRFMVSSQADFDTLCHMLEARQQLRISAERWRSELARLVIPRP